MKTNLDQKDGGGIDEQRNRRAFWECLLSDRRKAVVFARRWISLVWGVFLF
jgi:hypothetical protein